MKSRKRQRGQGLLAALALHPVGQHLGAPVAPVRADQVAVVDVGVVAGLALEELGAQAAHHIALGQQLVLDLNAGQLREGARQRARFVDMGVDDLREHLDALAAKGLGGLRKPLQLAQLLGGAQRAGLELAQPARLGGRGRGGGRQRLGRTPQRARRQRQQGLAARRHASASTSARCRP
jgi:hypothetical protein